MIDLRGGVFNRRQDVFALQKGVVGKDLLKRRTRTEQLKNVNDSDAFATNAGTSAALVGVESNSPEKFRIHRLSVTSVQPQKKAKGRNPRCPGPWH